MAPHARWPFVPFVAIFLIASGVLAWPWIAGGLTIPWDAKAHFYPQLVFLAKALHGGQSPFWAPEVFAGHPQIADPQSMIFSPPFLLLAAFNPSPSMRAMDATLFATLAAGGVAVGLLARDRGWRPEGAMVAALAFAFGCSAAWRVQHVGQILSLAYIPMALWCVERTLRARTWSGTLVWGTAGGVAGAALVLGRDQVAYIGALMVLAYALTRLGQAWRAPEVSPARSIAGLMVTGIIGLALALPPLLLTALFAAESNRLAIDLEGAGRGSLHPAYLLTLLTPDLFAIKAPLAETWGPPSPIWGPVDLYLARNMGVLYLGALPLVAILIAGVQGVFWRPGARFFALAAMVVLFYALGRYTPAFQPLFEHLPGVALFRRPADASFVLGLALALLAGFAVHHIASGTQPLQTRHFGRVGFVLAAGFAGIIGVAHLKGRLAFAAPAILEAGLWCVGAGLCLLALRRFAPARPMLATALLAVVLTADLARNNGPNESTALPTTVYAALDPEGRDPTILALTRELAARAEPDRRDRVELAGIGFHWPNASLIHGFAHTLGYNPVRQRLFSEATGAGDHVALPDQRSFSRAMPGYASPLANLLGLRLIAAGAPLDQIDRAAGPGQFPLLARTPDAWIYENRDALPRILFAGAAQRFDPAAVLEHGIWPDVDFRRTVLIEAEPPLAAAPDLEPEGAGTARIVRYANTEIEIEVTARRDGYLVLHNAFHPWWRATVDGTPTPILRANLIFRAVPVREGRRTVRFVFAPFSGAWADLSARMGR